ncbi:PilZ domain-containing protein [Onishia niordana]|uniref:PilZ domain-containing protein n=1 Tax=Onishia niordana TaxID=2508711 RepID=UPI00109F847D|nr:PilZ domain-containing protein [Halomonas niordiana]
MNDHHDKPVDGRREPTLARGDAQEKATTDDRPCPHSAAGESVQHERRDERRFIRMLPPFEVRLGDGQVLAGADLSLGGFAVDSKQPFVIGERIEASLRIMAGGSELIVPAAAECRHSTETGDGRHQAGFEITDIEPAHRELLRRIVRSCLSGRQVSVEGLLGGEDPQTPRKRGRTAAATSAQSASHRPRPFARYALLFLAFGVLLLVVAATAYRNFMLIEPSFAAVTAPRIEIRAPGPGIVQEHGFEAGDRVERDQRLTKVMNHDLQSNLILAEAAQRYNSQLIGNLKENLQAAGSGPVSLANSAKPVSGESVSYDTVSPEVARARIEQFVTARDFQRSRIAALESREAKNTIYSSCNCLVAWALSSADGTYINESERIMTLIRTGDDDILVEALVHMSDIDRIEPSQRAFIALPDASEPIHARVRSVALDIERQPRAGFPSWVRQQQNVASVLLVPENPLPADRVGTPVDVRFTEDPMLAATAEWIWQGSRSAIQFLQDTYHSARTTLEGAS